MRRQKIRRMIAGVLALLFIFPLFGCSGDNDGALEIADDEIMLKIQLDTKEDISLLIYDYSVSGQEHSGGISNADKSPMKHDEFIIQPMNKEIDFDNASDIEDLIIQFTIITEYVDPNYDNIYPEEYSKIIEAPIALQAHYGEAYSITIRGDQTNGYQAVLEPNA